MLVLLALFSLSIIIAQCAPEIQQQVAEPIIPARFRVIDSQFHQEPNLEYSFEWVYNNLFIAVVFLKVELWSHPKWYISINYSSQKFESGESFAEEGKLRTVNGQDVIVTKGSYTTVEQDGSLVRIDYVADENGFRVGE